MPEILLTVAKTIIDHDGMRSQLSVSTWEADSERPVSKYALALKQVNPTNIRISQGFRNCSVLILSQILMYVQYV